MPLKFKNCTSSKSALANSTLGFYATSRITASSAAAALGLQEKTAGVGVHPVNAGVNEQLMNQQQKLARPEDFHLLLPCEACFSMKSTKGLGSFSECG